MTGSKKRRARELDARQMTLPYIEPVLEPTTSSKESVPTQTALSSSDEGPASDGPSRDRPSIEAPPRDKALARSGARSIALGEHRFEYLLRRSQRRTIGFTIDDQGLMVTAPRWVTLSAIEEALLEKSRWIQRKMIEWREHARRRERLAIRWESGGRLPFLGEWLPMRIEPCARERRDTGVWREGDQLLITIPEGRPATELRDRVQEWVKSQARSWFAQRIAHYARLLGSGPSSWTLTSARTRWGSCGPDGAIRLNWRLMYFPPDIVDYVVAHELAHLRELNHSPRFWAVVGRLFPDYQRARDWLKRYPDDVAMT